MKRFILPLALGLAGCVAPGSGSHDQGNGDAPATPTATPTPLVPGLNVSVFLYDAQMTINVGAIPNKDALKCQLDDGQQFACSDGAALVLPKPGMHKVLVQAFAASGGLEAQGSTQFTVGTAVGPQPTPTSGPAPQTTIDLTVAATSNWANGSAQTVATPVSPGVSIVSASTSDCTPSIMCNFNGTGWRACTASTSFVASQLGLQKLTAHAQCGNKSGADLALSWYAVPANYQPLMIAASSDGSVALVKANDCDSSNLKFQCAAPGGSYSDCGSDGYSGYWVRAVCSGQKGQGIYIQ